MTYIHYQKENNRDTLGQCWLGQSINEGIALCKYQNVDDIFNKYLKKTHKILEAGCGLGRWVFYLNSQGYDIQGIELSDDAIYKKNKIIWK